MEAIAIGATGGRPQFFNHLAMLRGMSGFRSELPASLEAYFHDQAKPLDWFVWVMVPGRP